MAINAKVEGLSKVEALESLLRRLPKNHPDREFLEIRLYRASAGMRGESKMINKFKEFYIEEDYQQVWDLNMEIGNWVVQMDGLLLTNRCAIILESKNISDEIHFDAANDEFYKKTFKEGNKITLENPVIQLKKHIRFLERWFKTHKINLPVTGLIIFTANNCDFHAKPPGAFICKTYQMNEYLYHILEKYPQEASSHKINRIKKMILANQIPFKKSPLSEFYHIDPKDIKTGIYCRDCKSFSMRRWHKTWQCSSCGFKDSGAAQFAVLEYFALISTRITNKQLRDFCHIESTHAARRILLNPNLIAAGDLKSRSYSLEK
ncbi:nuclease-related domain-containing protein [Planomicrobium sp. Y74]|uniref:nuclease-related domain-containing protein n=1 Tax=Planomicrobium sp. Y74 TaxID=2478977 RepID=UPI0025707399|nr:nuclease-related domain-containing protein [Planomicrobium sp. Y74]